MQDHRYFAGDRARPDRPPADATPATGTVASSLASVAKTALWCVGMLLKAVAAIVVAALSVVASIFE